MSSMATSLSTPPAAEEVLSVAIQRRLPHFLLNTNFATSTGRIVLFGPSGAGKSITLQAIAGLFPLDRGRITRGTTVWHDSEAGIFLPTQQRRVGYLPQHYALFPHLNVVQNIAFGQRKQGREARKQIAELLHLMQLNGMEHLRPQQLSGGQQQRVALARALATEPQLLLLDEPWSALDASVRTILREEIRRFHEQFQVPLVLVTHDMLDVQALAETVVVIYQGRVLQMGAPEEIFRAPRTRQIADLVQMETCWTGHVCALEQASPQERQVSIELADLVLHTMVPTERAVSLGQRVEIGIRVDEISLAAESASAATVSRTSTSVEGRVIRDQWQGMLHMVTVRLASQAQAELTIPVPHWQHRELQITAGLAVVIHIPHEAVHLFENELS
jgi:molybdate transport system ATP-binding protein